MERVNEIIASDTNHSSYRLKVDATATAGTNYVEVNIASNSVTLMEIVGPTYDNSISIPFVSEHTHSIKILHLDLIFYVVIDKGESMQISLYVLAVAMIYGIIPTIVSMVLWAHRHAWVAQYGHSSLIVCNDVVQKGTVLRQKMNVLRLGGVQKGYILNQTPTHEFDIIFGAYQWTRMINKWLVASTFCFRGNDH